MYYNGVQVGNTITGLTPPLDTNRPWRFGWVEHSGFAAGNRFFNGKMDDVRFYNRALSAKEIEYLYTLGGGTKINVSTIPETSPLEDGLVGYWSFNGPDMTATTALDGSGSGNTGTLVNSPTKAIGKLGQALSLVRSSATFVSIPSSSSLNSTTAITLSAWIYPTAFSTTPTPGLSGIIGKYNSVTQSHDSWTFRIGNYPTNNTQLNFAFLDSGLAERNVYGTDVTLNVWQFVTATFDGATLRVYQNGLMTGETNFTGTMNSGSSTVAIGRDYSLESPARTFDGKIDEVRIYNRALGAEEVAQLYRSGLGSTILAAPLGGGEPAFTCGTDTVTDADANVYDTIEIGTQCWMQQNLRVGTRISGATTQTNNSTIEKWCYSDTDSNCTSNNPNEPDGGLYQWNEAMQYSTTPGAQGICPAGWHIPTDTELYTMENYLDSTVNNPSATGYRGTDIGTKLKPNGTSGFEANLAGLGSSGSFVDRGTFGFFWSSSESGANAWYRNVSSGSAQVVRSADDKTFGLSVRCLQD